MKTLKIATFVFFSSVFASAVFAETIQGTVISIDEQQGQIIFSPQDQHYPDRMFLDIHDQVDFQGLNSLNDLSIGDQIAVEATRSTEGGFDVSQVSLNEPVGGETWNETTGPFEEQPSGLDSLEDQGTSLDAQ